MLIDWFTVGTQALNFVVLVWLLKRFLYQPVLDAIDGREARIASQIAEAAAQEAKASAEQAMFQQKNEKFDREQAARWQQAGAEAEAERRRLVEEARQALDAAQAKSQDALRRDAVRLSRSVADRTRQEIFAITRKALAELSTTSLEQAMTEVFIGRLRELGGPARLDLAATLGLAGARATVRSAFELPPAQQAAIRAAVAEGLSSTAPIAFETAPGLLGGIELLAGGQKLAWNIDQYLTSLESTVEDLLRPAGNGAEADAVPAAAMP